MTEKARDTEARRLEIERRVFEEGQVGGHTLVYGRLG